MEINYLDYLKNIEGKSVDEINISEILKKDINYDLELLTVTKIQNDLIELERLLDSLSDSVALYMEKSIIYFDILRQYTALKISDEEAVVENYNIVLEEALKRNVFIKRCYLATQELNSNRKMDVIYSLSKALENIPKEDEMEKMTEEFKEIFSEDNKDNLKLLENIVAFNDPSMKALKEVVYDTSTDALIKAEDVIGKEENK